MSINEALFQALQPGVNQLTKQRADAQAAAQEAELKKYLQTQGAALESEQHGNDVAGAQALHKQYGREVPITVGKAHIGGVDKLGEYLKMLGLKDRGEDRERRAVQDIEDRATKAGTAQSVESLGRAEQSIPGISTGQANFKSVGGLKSLAPNWSVPILEKIHVMPEGSSDERAAIQDVQNTKIYDSSGKQINESEMKRIADAMGMFGGGPDSINKAMAQVGNTVLQKQKQVTAGAKPSALQTYKERGGLAGYNNLHDLLGKSGAGAPTPQQPQAAPQAPGGKVKVRRIKDGATGSMDAHDPAIKSGMYEVVQ